ncbi:XRE family transcriptional regulator [Flavobacterium silvisoli]|uniref:XRE family transcriptional regulator n=1 Tax=Flavobacterium silvisoli TaxID=2529433 RepID=A0A4Q9Z2A4_9FLAO|nr:helix-turn-helix transcriptional regulator [Flavobacterium silvisoli]TBX70433.1 XRE family transcriptional regulator [Flavobacterium silvisoli]
METSVHIGNLIKQYIDAHRLVRTEVAKQMGTPNTAIYAYEKRQYIHCQTLMRLCKATKHNFFMDIANALPREYTYNPQLVSDKDALLAQQAAEINKLTLENALLKELIMGKK